MAQDNTTPQAMPPNVGARFIAPPAIAKDNNGPPTTPAPSFEEAFAQLERTVQALDAGGLTLEQATTLFGEGMRLAKVCHDMLDATELKVRQLQVDFGQQIRLIDGGGNGPC